MRQQTKPSSSNENQLRTQALLADTHSRLIDGEPGLVKEATHKDRNWFASAGIEVWQKSFTEASSAFAEHLLDPVSNGRLPPSWTGLLEQ
jgi:hypothetical protein